jgi:hypothetical protein
MLCQPCRDRRHGPACDGCGCRCRAMLGLDLFEGHDPTAPHAEDPGWAA